MQQKVKITRLFFSRFVLVILPSSCNKERHMYESNPFAETATQYHELSYSLISLRKA